MFTVMLPCRRLKAQTSAVQFADGLLGALFGRRFRRNRSSDNAFARIRRSGDLVLRRAGFSGHRQPLAFQDFEVTAVFLPLAGYCRARQAISTEAVPSFDRRKQDRVSTSNIFIGAGGSAPRAVPAVPGVSMHSRHGPLRLPCGRSIQSLDRVMEYEAIRRWAFDIEYESISSPHTTSIDVWAVVQVQDADLARDFEGLLVGD
jgi:hypothetical protein